MHSEVLGGDRSNFDHFLVAQFQRWSRPSEIVAKAELSLRRLYLPGAPKLNGWHDWAIRRVVNIGPLASLSFDVCLT